MISHLHWNVAIKLSNFLACMKQGRSPQVHLQGLFLQKSYNNVMQSNHSSNTVLIGCCKQREIVIVCNWYIIELNLLRRFTKVSQQQLDLRLLVAAAWSGQPLGHDSCLVNFSTPPCPSSLLQPSYPCFWASFLGHNATFRKFYDIILPPPLPI